MTIAELYNVLEKVIFYYVDTSDVSDEYITLYEE